MLPEFVKKDYFGYNEECDSMLQNIDCSSTNATLECKLQKPHHTPLTASQ